MNIVYRTADIYIYIKNTSFLRSESVVYDKGDVTLAEAAPIPGSVQGQVGWSFEEPALVESIPVHAEEWN